jgi:two-component system chemotaxis response regulator CheB
MEKNKIITKVLLVGGSAGSLDILMQVLPGLPIIRTMAIVIVLHRKSSDDTLLEELIALKSATPVREIEDKVQLHPGFVYIAPAYYHLLFESNGLLSLDASEKVNYSRPSIDVSFESAAETYGSRVTGILLSGANNDGTHGLQTIQKAGGVIVVQTPESAEMAYMPQHAIAHTLPDYILDAPQIAQFIKVLDGID